MGKLFVRFCFWMALLSAANAQPYPPGLSVSSKEKFEEYNNRVIEAIRETQSLDANPADLIQTLPREYLIDIQRDVFDGEWSPLREYADAALRDLPRIPLPANLAGNAIKSFDLSDGNKNLFNSLSERPEFENGLSTARLWEPQIVAKTASSILIGKTTAKQVAHHAVANSFVTRKLAHTKWRDEDALIYFEGAYIFVMNYIRTPRGLIIATNMAMYER